MNEQFSTENTDTNIAKAARPIMLTVVCILSFIGSGWGIFDKILDYSGANFATANQEVIEDEMDEAMDELEDVDAPEGFVNFMEGFMGSVQESLEPSTIKKNAIGVLISCIITLTGAIMMFRLNKKGYYLYLTGIVIYVLTPALVYSGDDGIYGRNHRYSYRNNIWDPLRSELKAYAVVILQSSLRSHMFCLHSGY